MKKKISITLDVSLIEWLNKEVHKVEYTSRSHIIEIALTKYKESG
ncbi:ribbon-helix-helix protein, CopG family [Thermoproteota archaeon]